MDITQMPNILMHTIQMLTIIIMILTMLAMVDMVLMAHPMALKLDPMLHQFLILTDLMEDQLTSILLLLHLLHPMKSTHLQAQQLVTMLDLLTLLPVPMIFLMHSTTIIESPLQSLPLNGRFSTHRVLFNRLMCLSGKKSLKSCVRLHTKAVPSTRSQSCMITLCQNTTEALHKSMFDS